VGTIDNDHHLILNHHELVARMSTKGGAKGKRGGGGGRKKKEGGEKAPQKTKKEEEGKEGEEGEEGEEVVKEVKESLKATELAASITASKEHHARMQQMYDENVMGACKEKIREADFPAKMGTWNPRTCGPERCDGMVTSLTKGAAWERLKNMIIVRDS
jgi:hypothetical protein